MRTLRLLVALALLDLRAEPILSLCLSTAIAAVLAPLLVLGGLKLGAISELRHTLLENPHTREIVNASNRSFSATMLARIAARPDVQFLVPRTRTLAASLLLGPPQDPAAAIRVELVPSAAGDPLLPTSPLGSQDIVLSAAAAAMLHAAPGTRLMARLGRLDSGKIQDMALPLTVTDIAQPSAFSRSAAFVTLPFSLMVEDFQEGRIDPPVDLATLSAPKQDVYSGFRLYARHLEQVPVLDSALRAQGIDVFSHAADVAQVMQIDHGLNLLFALVAGLGSGGFLLSLGAGLWASLERKRKAFATLRLLGLRYRQLRLIPVVQALVLAVIGVAAASIAAAVCGLVINHMFGRVLTTGHPLCLVSSGLLLACGGATLLGAGLVAVLAGLRLSQLEPWEAITTL
jgi:putative ABC transport system permease protein